MSKTKLYLYSAAEAGALIIFYMLYTPLAFADDCPADATKTDLGCVPNSPGGFASTLYGIGLGMIGAVSLLFIVYGGYIILTSQGNAEQLNKGKSYIIYSIIGLVLAVTGFVLYQTIAVDILKIPGFSK